jgi:hypothetical protein
MKVPTLRLFLVLSSLIVAGPALAQAPGPKAGSKELRIGQNFEPPLELTNGIIRLEPKHGDGVTGMGLGAGLGYFVTDNVELGLSVDFELVKSGSTFSGPGASPFIRLFGSQGRIGYFVEGDFEYQHLGGDNTSENLISIGGDVGLEYFVTSDWAVRVSPTYRHVIVNTSPSSGGGIGPEASNSDSGNRFGVTWGLACYF